MFLGPTAYGLWHIIKILYMFGEQAGLGTSRAMVREVAYRRGAGAIERAGAEVYQNTAFGFGLIVAALLAVLGCVSYLWVLDGQRPLEATLTALAFVLSFGYLFARARLQSENRIVQIVKLSMSFVILNFVLGLSLLYVLSVSGLLLGVILSYSIVLGYLVYTGKLNLQIKVDPVVLKKLLAVGLPILLVSISGLLAYRIDSLVVYLLLGEESTGYFGIAVFIVLIVSNIPSSISYVIFPRMMSDMRENGEASVVARYTKMSTAFVAGFSPLFLGAIFICIGPILTLALSDYLAAIDCLHILIIALYFFSLQDMYSVALVAMGKQVATAAIQTTVVLLGGFLDVVVIKAGFGIEGVAIMTALTFYLLFLLLKTSAMRAWGSSPADMLSAMATKHVSFFFLLGALWLVRFLLDDSATSVLRLLGQLGLYVLITAPYLVFYLGRQYPQALQSLWRRDARPQEPIE